MAVDFAIAFAGAKLGAYFGVHLRARSNEQKAETRHPPKGRMVTVEGTPLHLTVEGKGPPLILLHGAGGNLRDFEPLMPALAQRFTVVRFDRPGLGHSGLPARQNRFWRMDAPTPVDQARLMARAYDTLGLGPAVILGQSYGGAVALGWALAEPASAAALVLVSAVSQPWPGRISWQYPLAASPVGALTFVPLVSAFATRGIVHLALRKIFAPQAPPTDYDRLLGLRLSLRRAAFRANARQVNTLYRSVKAMAPGYARLTLPVEMVHGDADGIVPYDVHAVPTAATLPEARLTRLPGIGHMPHPSAPQAVLAAIDRASERAGLPPAEQ